MILHSSSAISSPSTQTSYTKVASKHFSDDC
jgi:hypothetical protein